MTFPFFRRPAIRHRLAAPVPINGRVKNPTLRQYLRALLWTSCGAALGAGLAGVLLLAGVLPIGKEC